MVMVAWSAAMGLLMGVGAARGQDGRGELIPGWGQVTDPDGDCAVTLDGRKVVIKVPGKLHDLSPTQGRINAPTVLADIGGDFLAQVKVPGDIHPKGESKRAGKPATSGAGLLVWQDDQHYLRLERTAYCREKTLITEVNFQLRKGEGRPMNLAYRIPAGTCYLRLHRWKGKLYALVSPNGITWDDSIPPQSDPFASSIKVGVVAVNSDSQPFAAQLEELRVKKGEAPPSGRHASAR
jgi:hypothetical protein